MRDTRHGHPKWRKKLRGEHSYVNWGEKKKSAAVGNKGVRTRTRRQNWKYREKKLLHMATSHIFFNSPKFSNLSLSLSKKKVMRWWLFYLGAIICVVSIQKCFCLYNEEIYKVGRIVVAKKERTIRSIRKNVISLVLQEKKILHPSQERLYIW